MSVILQKSPFEGITPQELAQQIQGLQKAREKLYSWTVVPGIYYPPKLNMEQCSHELAADSKAALVRGEILVDLTGGFGVDAYYMSQRVGALHYCETDPELAAIAAHNFATLGAKNIEVHTGDGLVILKELVSRGVRPDWIYADPSRRHQKKGKVIRLEDYLPNIPANLEFLLEAAPNVLLKTSPMLDIAAGCRSLGPVQEIHLADTGKEVKELVWYIRRGYEGETRRCVMANYRDTTWTFEFTASEEATAECDISPPLKYLFEPTPALMKAGGFKLLGQQFNVSKLHPHTHLFTSDQAVDFPGRQFIIRQVFPYKPGKLGIAKANVSARNFPETVNTIRKRNKIQPGGDRYLFFVRTADESLQVLDCEPV